MRAALFKEPHRIDLIKKELPVAKQNELIIKIDTCGICGTDFHIFNGTAPAKNNTILGHEFSGVIIDKGKENNDFKVGDRVVVDPNIYCGFCSYCKEGNVHFCKNHKALGVTLDGGFAEYAVVPSSQVYLIPDDLPLNRASFAEPLSCCIRGIDRAQIKAGENVSIVGGGTIGLIMMQLAKLSGAANVIVIEPQQHKRELAIQLGADFVFSPDDSRLIDSIQDITHGGSNTAIECAGNSNAVTIALNLVRRGGKVIIFGLASRDSKIELNLQEAFRNEVIIKFSFLNPFTFSRAVELLSARKINVEKFSVSEVTFENLSNVLEHGNNTNTLKYQFKN